MQEEKKHIEGIYKKKIIIAKQATQQNLIKGNLNIPHILSLGQALCVGCVAWEGELSSLFQYHKL